MTQLQMVDPDTRIYAYRTLAVAVIAQAIRDARRTKQQQALARNAREWLMVEGIDWVAALTEDEIDIDVWCEWVQSGCNTVTKLSVFPACDEEGRE